MTSPNPFDRLRPTYRQAGNNRRRNSFAGRFAVVVLLALLCVLVLYWRAGFANFFWRVAAPATSLRARLESNSISVLQAELASTTAALADRNELAQENAELKRMLGRPQTSTEVLAAVILRPPGMPYDTLMIDAGSNDGIVADDIVFGGGTAAIGEVTEVYDSTSRVSLFSAPGRSYNAQVAPAANLSTVIPVSLEGQGAGSFTGQIPAGSAVAEGDSVLIPGLGNAFLGDVAHIDAPSGSSFETLYVQMPVDVFSLRYVEVQTHL